MLTSMPRVPLKALSREFVAKGSFGEVTSVEVVPHGAYVFCGLSDGQILLFDMRTTGRLVVLSSISWYESAG